MSWKVLITARAFSVVGEPARELLKASGCEAIIPDHFGPLPPEDLLRAVDGMDAVLCSPDPYTKELFGRPEAASLKIISRWGVGYDSIDVPAATEAGIVVAYTPGLLDDAVADYAFSLLLTLARHTVEVDATMKAGIWKMVWGCDIAGKTLGIIGCGRIGQAVACRARGFGMRLLCYDVFENPAVKELGVEYVTFEELLSESDFVTLHAALTPENHGMMDESAFRQMKSDAFFINTARGAHVDEPALAKALHEGWIGGAAVDAYVEEPLPQEHPFRSAPNLVLSPHQASSTRETGERISRTAAQAIVDLMNGKAPKLVVNREVFDSPSLRASF
ncbi:MAG: Glyoxylate/hydroxypyruvate reductase B [Verrucomicrobia subdivision 3 bacterium]|nr:Glyoxylate/hydroxypyruvate reductase B [Limisphaerales bacterium]MCS1412532.1 Glyoxylate/hydroxypyruvate reductase B [Limisphaerales bacterium]